MNTTSFNIDEHQTISKYHLDTRIEYLPSKSVRVGAMLE